MCSIQYSRIDSLAVDENCSGVLIFCPFVQKREAKLDPITDIFRTMHVTAFGLHRLEATAPWGVEQEKQTEENVTPSDKKMSPTDSAHFAMLSRGNCWLSGEGIPEPIPLTGGDCFVLARGTSIVLRDSPRTRPRWSFREIGAKAKSNVAHYGGGGAAFRVTQYQARFHLSSSVRAIENDCISEVPLPHARQRKEG